MELCEMRVARMVSVVKRRELDQRVSMMILFDGALVLNDIIEHFSVLLLLLLHVIHHTRCNIVCAWKTCFEL
jgi:hypothetical protein